MRQLAQAFLALTSEDVSLLKAIEAGMRGSEFVPLNDVSEISKISLERAEHLLRSLVQRGLIHYSDVGLSGYQIGFDAYDLLALKDLVLKDVIKSLGGRIGVGKESVVYEAQCQVMQEEEEEVDSALALAVIKFHREGRTSFRHVRRVRDHLKDRPRTSWLNASRLAAGVEYRALKNLYGKVAVPRPYGISRHALVMEKIDGSPMAKVRLENPNETFDIVLNEIAAALGAGYIHADLSEYNIIVGSDDLKIIDWPQSIAVKHPNAKGYLMRDVQNILNFFKRRYSIDMSLEDALDRIGRVPEA